jgi:NIPSNAP
MIVEQRIYTLATGAVPEYVRIYNELGRSVQCEILGNLLGFYQHEFGELNQLMFLWGFDSLDERARRRQVLMADTRFKQFRDATRHLLVRQDNRLLRPL